MDKVYLLLRNNQQTGPYHLDELVQQNLRPDDLIWTEGKSMTWLYPSEYEELKPYLFPSNKLPGDAVAASNDNIPDIPASHHATNIRHIYVSLPDKPAPATHPTSEAESLEQQAEALRKRVEAYALAHPPDQRAEHQPPAYIPKTVNDLEQDYITWLHRQTRTKRNRIYKRVGIAAFIILSLSGGGYLLAKEGLITRQTTALTANRSLHSESAQKAKQRNKAVPQNTMAATFLPDSTAIADTVTTLPVTNNKTSNHPKQKIATIKIQVPEVLDTQSNNLTDRPPVVVDSNKIIVIKEDKSEAAAAVKNNTLGQKISRLFKRHKRQKEEETDSRPPVEKADVSLTSYNIAGAPNVNITLRNRSGEAIKTAVVEVRYYNKQNTLIEKKLVHFSNIAPHDTVMQVFHSLPSTDHIYYQLLPANRE